MITQRNVHIDTALKTPQFWLLWTTLCCNVTAGIGVIGVAKTMIDDIFGTTLPHLVTASFAAAYVQMISVFNMGGRFMWASASDYLGRKNTFHTFFGLGIPLYLSVPMSAALVSSNPSVVPLLTFCGATMVIFTMYVWAALGWPAARSTCGHPWYSQVRWRICDNSGVPRGCVRYQVRWGDPWAAAYSVEYCWSRRPDGHHLPAPLIVRGGRGGAGGEGGF